MFVPPPFIGALTNDAQSLESNIQNSAEREYCLQNKH